MQDKVTKVLGGAESTAAAAGSGVHGGGERAYALAFAQAALFVTGTYNSCLGDAITAAEDAAEDLQVGGLGGRATEWGSGGGG